MSANTLTPYFDDDNHVPAITWADGQHKRRKAQSALATSVIATSYPISTRKGRYRVATASTQRDTS